MPCKKLGKCYKEGSVETPWSYVVLTSGFFVFVLIAIIYIPSVYYITFYDVFGVGKGLVSWVGSLMAFCMKFVGPVSSAFTNRFGGRPIMIAGTLCTATGLITSMFAQNIYHLYGTLGVISGIGLGLLFAPTSAAIGLYFDRHRTLAIGLSATGVGMGMFIYPPLVRWLIHEFGWRGSFLILGGIYLNAIPLTLLIQPIAVTPDDHPTHPKHVKRLGWSFHLLKKREFLCLCFGYFTTMFFATTVFHHLPSYAYTLGVPADQASMLLSSVGIASIVGRLFFSFCGQHPRVSVSIAYTIAFICAGILTFTCPMFQSYVALLVYGPAFGFFVSPITGYMTDQVIAAVGIEYLVAGIGYVMAFAGCGILIGPPSAGWLFDVTQNYVYSFLMAALVNVIGVLCLFGTWPCFRKGPLIFCPVNLNQSDPEMNGDIHVSPRKLNKEDLSRTSQDSEKEDILHNTETKITLLSKGDESETDDVR